MGRAALAAEMVPEVKVFGSLVLNRFAGGLNPVAVEHALELGAKQIYMPTLDALAHMQAHGMAGGTDWQSSGTMVVGEAVTVLDGRGDLLPGAKQIVELVRDAGAILGTAHLGVREIIPLARFCSVSWALKVCSSPTRTSIHPSLALTLKGSWPVWAPPWNSAAAISIPYPAPPSWRDYLASLKAVGPERLILSSDAGQARKSAPAEVLRIFAQCLMEKGVSQKAIDLMTKQNPQRLLVV